MVVPLLTTAVAARSGSMNRSISPLPSKRRASVAGMNQPSRRSMKSLAARTWRKSCDSSFTPGSSRSAISSASVQYRRSDMRSLRSFLKRALVRVVLLMRAPRAPVREFDLPGMTGLDGAGHHHPRPQLLSPAGEEPVFRLRDRLKFTASVTQHLIVDREPAVFDPRLADVHQH